MGFGMNRQDQRMPNTCHGHSAADAFSRARGSPTGRQTWHDIEHEEMLAARSDSHSHQAHHRVNTLDRQSWVEEEEQRAIQQRYIQMLAAQQQQAPQPPPPRESWQLEQAIQASSYANYKQHMYEAERQQKLRPSSQQLTPQQQQLELRQQRLRQQQQQEQQQRFTGRAGQQRQLSEQEQHLAWQQQRQQQVHQHQQVQQHQSAGFFTAPARKDVSQHTRAAASTNAFAEPLSFQNRSRRTPTAMSGTRALLQGQDYSA